MRTLAEIYENYKSPASFGDKGTVHSYIEIYEHLLAPYRLTATRVIEIGILTGVSLRMWEDFFFKSTVHGIDASLTPLNMGDLSPVIAEGTHHISILDAANSTEVQQHFGNMQFDVIIEDASHALNQQQAIYANFKPLLTKDGIYIIEDIDNIDATRPLFEKLDPTRRTRIFDRRAIKGRFDDVLVVIGGVDAL